MNEPDNGWYEDGWLTDLGETHVLRVNFANKRIRMAERELVKANNRLAIVPMDVHLATAAPQLTYEEYPVDDISVDDTPVVDTNTDVDLSAEARWEACRSYEAARACSEGKEYDGLLDDLRPGTMSKTAAGELEELKKQAADILHSAAQDGRLQAALSGVPVCSPPSELTPNELQDLVDLDELGADVKWPVGMCLSRAKEVARQNKSRRVMAQRPGAADATVTEERTTAEIRRPSFSSGSYPSPITICDSGLTNHAGVGTFGSAMIGCTVPVSLVEGTISDRPSVGLSAAGSPPENGVTAPQPVRLQSIPAQNLEDVMDPCLTDQAQLGTELHDAMRAKPDRRGERQKQAANRARRADEAARRVTTPAPLPPATPPIVNVVNPDAVDASHSVVANNDRSGERRRQADNKRQREQEALAEAASKRRRTVVTLDEATTPAAKAMARLRERVLAKK